MVCEQATKGREEGERGGLIPHSRFLFYDNPAFRASLIFLTNTVFLANTRHFAFTQFPHYGENPDPENRDFKIGHYGRLGRLDAYTGCLGP